MIPMPGTASPEPDLELPDAFTLLKILWLATKQKYHHIVLFALLINELVDLGQWL